ncbi:MAG: ATP-binding domain-containing protein [Mycoplasmoidaceae bacterium]|nr:ATP-binding domain-containing protein [Mycoplasmoidaceae bacterium]
MDMEDKVENVQELINNIQLFEEENKEATILSYLQEISLYIDTSEHKLTNENNVSLMTVHVAKGSEYKVVFVAGFSNNLFPPARSDDFQEERRIAYVAMTRAREQLYLTCSYGYSYSGGSMGPSVFIKEVGQHNLKELKTEFTTISKADLT